MKAKIVFVISSLLLALSLTSCPGGTTGQINATFSNASGTTAITLEPFSAATLTSRTTLLLQFSGSQGNRVIELQFAPPFRAATSTLWEAVRLPKKTA